jgi:ribonuclease III
MNQVRKIIESIKETQTFRTAFTHSSYLNENNLESPVSYETLEFLGDSILNFYVSLFIYQSFPEYSEGKMSKLKQLMIKESTLAYLSNKIVRFNRVNKEGRLEYLRLGEGERKNGGAFKESILSDIFESFIAALYLEKGGKAVWKFLNLTLFPWSKGKENTIWDYKSQLQEYCQSCKIKLRYLELEKRSKNQQLFVVKAVLEVQGQKENNQLTKKKITIQEKGAGRTKQEAEQEAAAKVLAKITPEQRRC